MAKQHSVSRNHMRDRICDLAARLMAEDGIQDYSLAKRKAARRLGAEDTRHLPDNSEIEAALRQRFALYQPQQETYIQSLRECALGLMQKFLRFTPRLIGPVLSGSATRFAGIELMVFCEDLNEILFFFIQEKQAYKLTEQSFKLNGALVKLPAVLITEQMTGVTLIVAPKGIPSMHLCAADGRKIDSANLARVQALLSPSARSSAT